MLALALGVQRGAKAPSGPPAGIGRAPCLGGGRGAGRAPRGGGELEGEGGGGADGWG